MTCTIRKPRHSDYGFLMEVFTKSNQTHLELAERLYRPKHIHMERWQFHALVAAQRISNKVFSRIAEANGKPVGAVLAFSQPRSKLSWSVFNKEVYIDNVVVDPEYRRQGIGTALLQATEAWARGTEHKHGQATILFNNNPSLGLFDRQGYAIEKIIMGKHLE